MIGVPWIPVDAVGLKTAVLAETLTTMHRVCKLLSNMARVKTRSRVSTPVETTGRDSARGVVVSCRVAWVIPLHHRVLVIRIVLVAHTTSANVQTVQRLVTVVVLFMVAGYANGSARAKWIRQRSSFDH